MADIGTLYVIAAPSGTGKTTLVKALTDSVAHITVSISHTTRAKRPTEVDGINYYFVDKAKFTQMINAQDFLEYAVIFDNYYGTSKSYVTETLNKGRDVILEIDWQGHQQIKTLFPSTRSIFILPPSFHDLELRLTQRQQDKPDIIAKRLSDAKTAVAHIAEFDYIVVNDDFQQAIKDLQAIIQAGRLTQKRQAANVKPIIQSLSALK